MTQELLINRIFSERNTSDTIMFLYLFGPKGKTEIYDAISRNPRMPMKLQMLEDYGLVRSYSDGGKKMMIGLTPKGNKFASALSDLEKIVGGNVEAFRWGIVMSKLEDFDRAVS